MPLAWVNEEEGVTCGYIDMVLSLGLDDDLTCDSGEEIDYMRTMCCESIANVCSEGCSNNWISDGICDEDCYNPECNYDGGDCGDEALNERNSQNILQLYLYASVKLFDFTHRC